MADPSHRNGAAPDSRSPQERRVSIRLALQRDAFLQTGPGRADYFWRFAKMLDLSPTGIRLISDCGFPADTPLVVELSSIDGNFSRTVPARVVHATEEANGWLIGCAFDASLSAEEIAQLR